MIRTKSEVFMIRSRPSKRTKPNKQPSTINWAVFFFLKRNHRNIRPNKLVGFASSDFLLKKIAFNTLLAFKSEQNDDIIYCLILTLYKCI